MKYLILLITALTCFIVSVASIKSVKPETKFCYNCKNCLPNKSLLNWNPFDNKPDSLNFAKCKSYPSVYESNNFYVTGRPKVDYTVYEYCSFARNDPNKCGPEGKDYVAKDGR